MQITNALAAALLLTAGLAPNIAHAEIKTDTVRQRAEQACYDDATKFCNDAIPDEAKITACMTLHKAKLSPNCRSMFDADAK